MPKYNKKIEKRVLICRRSMASAIHQQKCYAIKEFSGTQLKCFTNSCMTTGAFRLYRRAALFGKCIIHCAYAARLNKEEKKCY